MGSKQHALVEEDPHRNKRSCSMGQVKETGQVKLKFYCLKKTDNGKDKKHLKELKLKMVVQREPKGEITLSFPDESKAIQDLIGPEKLILAEATVLIDGKKAKLEEKKETKSG